MKDSSLVVIGARESRLSIKQTNEVIELLKRNFPDCDFQYKPIKTTGDIYKNDLMLSLGRGMFVNEIQSELMNGNIDIAVHSAKDLTVEIPEDLIIGAYTKRLDARDVLISSLNKKMENLPQGAIVGTSSPRRKVQLKNKYSNINILPIRGNVETRIEKIKTEEYDAVVLAAAGLIRLGLENIISQYISIENCIPDVGQGTLAIQCRKDNSTIIKMLDSINHKKTNILVRTERAFVHYIGGGCVTPIAAYASMQQGGIKLSAMGTDYNVEKIFRTNINGLNNTPEEIGYEAANNLFKLGAFSFL